MAISFETPAPIEEESSVDTSLENLKRALEEERERRLSLEQENLFQQAIIFTQQKLIISQQGALERKDRELAEKEEELNTDKLTGLKSERGLEKLIERRK